jgi:hypothetical protein
MLLTLPGGAIIQLANLITELPMKVAADVFIVPVAAKASVSRRVK